MQYSSRKQWWLTLGSPMHDGWLSYVYSNWWKDQFELSNTVPCVVHSFSLWALGITDLQSRRMMYMPPVWLTTGLSCCAVKWHAKTSIFPCKSFVFCAFYVFLGIHIKNGAGGLCESKGFYLPFHRVLSSSSQVHPTLANHSPCIVALCVYTCTLWHNKISFMCITTAFCCVVYIYSQRYVMLLVRIHTPLTLWTPAWC